MILVPNTTYMNKVSAALDVINEAYCDHLNEYTIGNAGGRAYNDDDADLLADYMTKCFDGNGLNIEAKVGDGHTTVDWYIQGAEVLDNGGVIILLDEDSINGHWGPESFKAIIIRNMEHECVHLAQRERMGEEKYGNIPSGYQRAKKLDIESEAMRVYLGDSHELMARGHDLCREIQNTDNPQASLRNPEAHRDVLPTYETHRAVFAKNEKELQKLLKYTAEYIGYYGSK